MTVLPAYAVADENHSFPLLGGMIVGRAKGRGVHLVSYFPEIRENLLLDFPAKHAAQPFYIFADYKLRLQVADNLDEFEVERIAMVVDNAVSRHAESLAWKSSGDYAQLPVAELSADSIVKQTFCGLVLDVAIDKRMVEVAVVCHTCLIEPVESANSLKTCHFKPL